MSALEQTLGGPANTEHHHRGLGLLTPADVHHGRVEQRRAARATVLATAYAAHPERFSAGLPQPAPCPTEVWINPPPTRAIEEALTH
jgi:putative transposase